jgi:hypothetical protein
VYTGGGFEPGDIAPFILKSLNAISTNKPGDQPLPANPPPTPDCATNSPPSLARPRRSLCLNFLRWPRYLRQDLHAHRQRTDLASLTLQFNKSSEATVRFTRLGQELRCPVGLDGVERFSTDKLVELPFACKGRWLDADTFLLELDRVAGISLYRFKLTFSEEGTMLHVTLSERTGLGEEQFNGSAPR